MLASDYDNDDRHDAARFSLASDIVELVIFTNDDGFMQTLRDAVVGSRRLWHVPSVDKVSNLLLAGEVGILVLDVQALPESANAFITEIKRQFPDLVVMVAGHRDAESSLANLISAGIVHRFIHKPLSPGRAKLFADAAVKKYEEQRQRASAPRPSTLASARSRWLAVATLGVLIGALVAAWGLRPRSSVLGTSTKAVAVNSTSIELARHPSGPAAVAGPDEVQERWLARAENALLEERLDEAALAIEAASNAGVDGGRIAFLSAQLGKSRERLKAAMAQAHPKGAPQPAAGSAGQDTLTQALSLAAERIKQGRFIGPDGDSARFYVRQAMQLDPTGNATEAAAQTLAVALLSQAHEAIDRRDFGLATSLLDAAEGIAAAPNVENVRQLLGTARKQADSDAWDQLLKSGQERLQQDRLTEPSDDSAKYYLTTLRGVNPDHAGLAPALEDLGLRLVAKARRALNLQQYDAARSWLNEAAAVGYASADSGAASQEVETAVNRQRFLGNVVGAGELTLVKSVKPSYPRKAEADRIEGWVELDFTVAESGDVKDIAVHAANPTGTFDDAAIGALSQWRYQPVLHDAKPGAQRARIRIRFTLPG